MNTTMPKNPFINRDSHLNIQPSLHEENPAVIDEIDKMLRLLEVSHHHDLPKSVRIIEDSEERFRVVGVV